MPHLLLLTCSIALLAACAQTPPPAPPPKVQPAPVDDAPAPDEPPPEPAAAPAPPPRPPTAQERGESQKLAQRAVELLNAGDEATARRDLEKALALDAENKLATLLMRQITEDPVAFLGTQSFTYRLQRDDSLSIVARKFLGDVYLFYILARYNDIKVPRQVHVGQAIRVPGKGPPAVAEAQPGPRPKPERQPKKPPVAPPDTAAPPPAPAPAPEPSPAVSPSAKAYQQGVQLLKSGDKEGAYARFNEAARLDAQNGDARARAQQLRSELVQDHHRLATTAFRRQDMKTAIKHWDRVLELEPGHTSARAQRQQAIELSSKLDSYK